MFVSASEKNISSFENFTLFVPCISVGNVGQLTADLIISTLDLKRQGYMYDDSILPVVGSNPFDNSENVNCSVTTAVEVYGCWQKKIAVVQQRAPCIKGKRKQYIEKLLLWIKSNGFKQVVVLTSSFAHERRDLQLQGSQTRFLLTPETENLHKTLTEELSWIELEKRALLPGVEDYNEPQLDGGHMEEYFIPGSGMARQLMCQLIEHKVPAVLTLCFCEEGDNANDAIQLASYLNTLYKWVDVQKLPDILPPSLRHGWKIPSSWRLQYGSKFQQMLYQ